MRCLGGTKSICTTSCSLAQTATRITDLTYTGVFGLFWKMEAGSQAAAFSLVSQVKVEKEDH